MPALCPWLYTGLFLQEGKSCVNSISQGAGGRIFSPAEQLPVWTKSYLCL